jgi:DinB superfamily
MGSAGRDRNLLATAEALQRGLEARKVSVEGDRLRRVDGERSIVGDLVERVAFVHSAFEDGVAGLDEETFHARPGAKAPSIAFHLWHAARWSDAFQERFASFAPELELFAGREQIWMARGLADAWGVSGSLGIEATGSGLDDDASAALPLPDIATVLDYARAAFAAAEDVFGDVRDDELLLPTGDFADEGGWVVIRHFGWYLIHSSRHLGMIEALKGFHGIRGTATV